jgi:hypothetical protein
MTKSKKTVQSRSSRRKEHEIEVGVSGALAGGAIGAIAGPPGALVGAVFGAVVGALAGATLDDGSVDAAVRDAALDDAIGISGGDLGAPNLLHPPALVGAYSANASGAGETPEVPPADGPMQTPGS